MRISRTSKLGDITGEEFAGGIKGHRDRLGITQAEAATLCRVSLRVWADWERNVGGEPLYPTKCGTLGILEFARVKK